MIADIGYGLNSLAYLVLLLLLLTVRKSGLAKYLLMLATMATLAWSLSMLSVLRGPMTLNWLLSADAGKQLIWLLFIASCLRDDFNDIWQVLKQPVTAFILLPPLVTLIAPVILPVEPSLRYLANTILALEALILLEVMFRQTGANQWAFKPLVLYLGATQLFEFVTYANATIIDQIEVGYIAARGYIYLLLMPLLIVAIRRIKHWGVDIFISRDVVLHSSLLLVAGAYLFVMAMIGYVINYLGGSWGATVQIILIALSLVLLATLVLSNAFRTKIKVFITKHFFANQYDYRVEWVKLTKALSSPSSDSATVYQHALEGVLNAIGYDTGRLVKVINGKWEQLAVVNAPALSANEQQTLTALALYCEQTSWLIDIKEYQHKPFAYNGLSLNRPLLEGCAFQLALPFFRDEKVWGFALLKAVDREEVSLNWEVRDYLTAVTDQVATFVYHHEAARAVAENAQFAAFNRMSAFVLHDLKNVLAQIDLILANADKHKHNPEFIDDTFETLHHTKARMDKMLRQLTEKKVEEARRDEAHLLSKLIRHVIDNRCQSFQPVPVLHCQEESAVVVDPEKLSNVIYHLISNAQQATTDRGRVEVVLNIDPVNQRQRVLIEDDGCGMDQEFINHRLFTPFDTTKGNAGMGIGAYDAKNYMESIGGNLSVQSEPGKGSCFTLTFPLT